MARRRSRRGSVSVASISAAPRSRAVSHCSVSRAAVGLALVDLRLPIVAGGLVLLALGALLAFVMPESGVRARGTREEVSALRAMTRTARRGGRLIRTRPILLLVLGITFFGGMWSESVDRLWEAQFLVEHRRARVRGLQLRSSGSAILNAGAVLLAIASRSRSRAASSSASWRGMTWSLFWLDSVMVATTLAFAFAGELRCGRARVLGHLRREVARRARLLDLAQREHRGLERARDGHLDDESR